MTRIEMAGAVWHPHGVVSRVRQARRAVEGAAGVPVTSEDDRRAWRVAARFALAWLLVRRLGFSLSRTGRVMGRDHTTILHAVRSVDRASGPSATCARLILARVDGGIGRMAERRGRLREALTLTTRAAFGCDEAEAAARTRGLYCHLATTWLGCAMAEAADDVDIEAKEARKLAACAARRLRRGAWPSTVLIAAAVAAGRTGA